MKQLRQLTSVSRTRLSRGGAKGRRLFRRHRLRKGNADHDSKSNYRISHVMLPIRVQQKVRGKRRAKISVPSLSLGQLQFDASIAAIGILGGTRIDRLLIGKPRRSEPRRGDAFIDGETHHR